MGRTIEALALPVGGAPRWVQVPAGDDGSLLAGLQARVDGYVEAVDLGEHAVMWCNEEALIRAAEGAAGFGLNPAASLLAGIAGREPLVLGPGVVTGQAGGDTVSLPRRVGDALVEATRLRWTA